MKWKCVPDFGPDFNISDFFHHDSPDYFGNTEIWFILRSNYSVCLSWRKNVFQKAGINVVNTFINFYTEIP